MKKISVGILGTGAVAYRWYLRGLCNENNHYSVDILCDIDEEAVKKASNEFRVDNYCTNIKDLLATDVDLVVILTRHEDHFEHIKECLLKGKHVYSEKPFSENFVQGKELYDMAQEKKLIFGSAPQIMFSSRNAAAKKFISEGKLGKLTCIKASGSNPGPAGRKDTNYDPEWFYNSGGSLKSLGIYTLSALIWIIGLPKKITGYMGISLPDRKVRYGPFAGKRFAVTAYDNVCALFDFGNSIYALYDGCYCTPHQSKYEFEIHGEKGTLYIQGFGGPESIVYKDLEGNEKLIGPNDDCHIKWNLSMGVEDTIMAIRENRQPKASSLFALNVIKVMDAMEESSKTGRSIDFVEYIGGQ